MIRLCAAKKNSDSLKIGIYVRESRDENEENIETIETQKDLLLYFAQNNNLGEVYKVYVDDNYSGTTFDRPAIKELQQDILKGQIQLLLVKDLSRLGRNNAKTLVFLDFLEEQGVRLISSDGRFDSNEDGDLVGIETWFNERYAKDISRKIRSNLKHKISRGEFLGKPPYGYVKSNSKKNALQINVQQAEIVNQIYKMYLDGFGYSKIARSLNENNIPSPAEVKGTASNLTHWNSVAIQRILTNRVYLGETIQGVSEKISFKSKKTRRLPSDKWIITPNTHEKIIDEATFLKVEKIREEKRSKFTCTDKGEIHTYRGKIFCGKCNSIMFARKRTGRDIGYICKKYSKSGKNACSSHYIKEIDLNNILAGELSNVLKDMTLINELNQEINKNNITNKNNIQKEKLNKDIWMLKNKQEKIYLDMFEGIISRDLFTRLNTTIEVSLTSTKDKLLQMENIKIEDLRAETIIQAIIELCKAGKLPYQLANQIVKKIYIFDKGECLQSSLQGENTQMNDTEGVIFVELNI